MHRNLTRLALSNCEADHQVRAFSGLRTRGHPGSTAGQPEVDSQGPSFDSMSFGRALEA